MQSAPPVAAVAAMTEAQMTSAAAFVEGGVQDACDDDTCSICLEDFCESDPATVTTCKHEYHLQCILEWSQRSKECPMCWGPLSLKDPDSQSLLAASEQERLTRPQRSSPFNQRPSPFNQRSPLDDDHEFHRFAASYGDDDSDLEDRIMQHLAAAAMGRRAQQFARREDALRFRPSPGQGHPHFMIVPAHPNASSSAGGIPPQSMPGPDTVSLGGNNDQAAISDSTPPYVRSISEPVRGARTMESGSLESFSMRQPVEESQHGTSSSSELSFSETFKLRLAAASSRYRESLTKTTRGFRERLRVGNGPMTCKIGRSGS